MRRSHFTLLLPTALLGLLCAPAWADPAADARLIVQSFYDRYSKVTTDTQPWVKKSTQVTPAFKKAYTAFMKDADYDPIIAGQDSPSGGYHATAATVKADHATVTMSSKEEGFRKPITVHLLQVNGVWLINGVNDLRGK